jgi:hypothetical protein
VVLDLCQYFIWILAGLQHPQHIGIGVHELYVYRSIMNLINILNIMKEIIRSRLLLAAPHKHQVNIKTAKANFEYHSQMVANGNLSNDQVILPFRPLSLVFDHINYFVDMPKVIS